MGVEPGIDGVYGDGAPGMGCLAAYRRQPPVAIEEVAVGQGAAGEEEQERGCQEEAEKGGGVHGRLK